MSISQNVKDNPVKSLLGVTGSMIAVVTALFTVDARYAHAADVEKDNLQTQRIIQDTAIVLRKQMLEDKLFELDIKKEQAPERRLSPVDSALQQRYKRQLEEIVVRKSLN